LPSGTTSIPCSSSSTTTPRLCGRRSATCTTCGCCSSPRLRPAPH
jgi:hypothetical protein